MRKLKNYYSALLFGIATCFAVSCDDNDEIAVDPNANFDAVLEVSEGGTANPNVDVNVTKTTGSILAKVAFTSTTKSMKRLYITQNVQGQGENVYEPTENIDLKADGAVDLEGKDDNSFEFQFELPVPNDIDAGTVVYKFWTTTGNGDFRDMSQRLAVGPGTITLKYGSGTNPNAGTADVKEYTNVKLIAPSADGTSNTFVSLLDGKTYNVKQGIEYVSLWDFGYLYSGTDGATLRSPYNYNVPYYPNGTLDNPVIDIVTLAKTTNDELNRVYFKESTTTTTEFDAVAISSDLDFVTVTENNDNIRVTDLQENNVIEFVDQYGKKGLIKVIEIEPGNTPDDYIIINIKVQP